MGYATLQATLLCLAFASDALLTIARLESTIQVQTESTLHVSVPASAVNATCSIIRHNRIVERHRGRDLHVSCPASDEVISCDGSGIEPVDAHVADLCRNGSLPLNPADQVTIMVDQPVTLTTEWLSLNQRGELVTVATRTAEAKGSIRVQVARRVDRLLRFSRPGVSPVTVPVGSVFSREAWRLPDPRPGGELVAIVQPAAVLPISYRFAGASILEIHRGEDQIVARQGVPPGEYYVSPIYEGGLIGERVSTAVDTAKSTVLFLRWESVGSARIRADPAECAAATEFVVVHVNRSDSRSGGTIRTELVRTNQVSLCQWNFAGLRSGTYEALLLTAQGSGGSQEFSIDPQQLVEVVLPRPTVMVSGRVLYAGEPASGKSLRFVGARGEGEAHVTTDSMGTYQVTLDRAGDYTVTLSSESLVQARRVKLTSGVNNVDWEIERGAVLAATVTGLVGEEATDVQVRGLNASGFWSIKPLSSDGKVRWEGLPYGSYEISARQGRYASQLERVVLSANHPSRLVELILKENSSTLLLRDVIGQPVRGAKFPLLLSQPPELAPGIYSLEGLVPGSKLRIRPPGNLVPICRTIPRDGTLDVTLGHGRAVTLQFPVSEMDHIDSDSARLTATSGSDCPIPLTDFVIKKLPTAPGEPSRFLVQNFPSDDGPVLETPHGRQKIVVSSSGLVQIRR